MDFRFCDIAQLLPVVRSFWGFRDWRLVPTRTRKKKFQTTAREFVAGASPSVGVSTGTVTVTVTAAAAMMRSPGPRR